MRGSVDCVCELLIRHSHLGTILCSGENGPWTLRVVTEVKVDNVVEGDRTVSGRVDEGRGRRDHYRLKFIEFSSCMCKSEAIGYDSGG